jgi:hypothetical protein
MLIGNLDLTSGGARGKPWQPYRPQRRQCGQSSLRETGVDAPKDNQDDNEEVRETAGVSREWRTGRGGG